MRIDFEQFLAATVVLGAAGAVGLAVYSSRDSDASELESVERGLAQDVVEPRPAMVRPGPTAWPRPALAPPTSRDLRPGDTPGPDVETPVW